MYRFKRSYCQNVLVGLDQFVGTLFGVDADLTISGYIGWQYPDSMIENIINFLFSDPHHCQKNIEWDIIKRDYINNP